MKMNRVYLLFILSNLASMSQAMWRSFKPFAQRVAYVGAGVGIERMLTNDRKFNHARTKYFQIQERIDNARGRCSSPLPNPLDPRTVTCLKSDPDMLYALRLSEEEKVKRTLDIRKNYNEYLTNGHFYTFDIDDEQERTRWKALRYYDKAYLTQAINFIKTKSKNTQFKVSLKPNNQHSIWWQ